MKSRVFNEYLETALYTLPVGLTIGFLYNRIKMVDFLVSLAVGLLAAAAGCNLLVSNLILSLTLILMVNYYVHEGFSTHTSQANISSMIKKLKATNSDGEGFVGSNINQNILSSGYNNPGFGMRAPLVEGFEDEKKETKVKESKPASVEKQELASPFKLGEIPTQVKNGPHIDAGSTLMKAIQGLNPDQINAMTKDTQQLIETQKSLMGMLGSMKPMMKDGKELMDTFQQMFGNQ
jgi:hypothetical protein